MVVDLVRDGPHGLVGGTSGSGKTEFLKTLLVSLCLNNHPDDLSIVIVDFKGGVDHDAVRPIPHVVDVATNLDIEQFQRTIVMLKAESRRRQDLLARAGASNLDSYRLARRPRAASCRRCPGCSSSSTSSASCWPARAGASSSRSWSRSPASGAPSASTCCSSRRTSRATCRAQIDANAGLRICLRVQQAGPLQGRAQLGHRGDDPRPLRRPGLRPLPRPRPDRVPDRPGRRPPARSRRDRRRRPTCASSRSRRCRRRPPDRRPEDVPVEETDMYAARRGDPRGGRRQRAGRAARCRGRRRCPSSVSVSVAGRATTTATACRWPCGPARRAAAARSRRSPTATSTSRFIGGPNAPLPEVLTTYATSLALLRQRRRRPRLRHRPRRAQPRAAGRRCPHCGGVASATRRWRCASCASSSTSPPSARWRWRRPAAPTSGSTPAVTGELPPQVVLLVSGADRLLMSSRGRGEQPARAADDADERGGRRAHPGRPRRAAPRSSPTASA